MSKKKMMKSRPVNEGDILKRLSAGLSEEEIRRILAGALHSLDQADVDRLPVGWGLTRCAVKESVFRP